MIWHRVYQCWSSFCLRQTGRKNAIHSSSNHSNIWLFIWGYLMAFWHRRKIQIIIKSWDFESNHHQIRWHHQKTTGNYSNIPKSELTSRTFQGHFRTTWGKPSMAGLRGGGNGTRGEDLRRRAGAGEEGGDGQPSVLIESDNDANVLNIAECWHRRQESESLRG